MTVTHAVSAGYWSVLGFSAVVIMHFALCSGLCAKCATHPPTSDPRSARNHPPTPTHIGGRTQRNTHFINAFLNDSPRAL
eukprot:5648475-Prymnesium_polylepis.1